MAEKSKKTGIVNAKHQYNKIVGIKSKKEFTKKYGCLERGLNRCLEIFFDKKFQGGKDNPKSELVVYEIIDGKKEGQPYKCDNYAIVDNKHVIFEFNGNHHYQSSFKIDTDKRKRNALGDPNKNTDIRNGPGREYKIFKVPYYMQLTKDYAKYLFHDRCIEELGKSYYSDAKYMKAIKSLYNVENEKMVYAPGLHNSKQTPANYNEEGLKRFLKEMDEMSSKYPSIRHQFIHSLNLYIKDVPKGKEHLIVPLKNTKFTEWFSLKVDEKYLNCIFERSEEVYKF